MKKTKFILLLGIIMIAAIVLSGLIFLVGKNREKAVAPIETAGWKNYYNENYRFEFTYPENWIVKDDLTLHSCCLNIYNYDPLKKEGQFLQKGEIKIQISKYEKPESQSLKDFVSSQTHIESSTKATIVEDITVGQVRGVKSNLVGDGVYYLPKSSTNGITITIFGNPQSKKVLNDTVYQIISTVKFTK